MLSTGFALSLRGKQNSKAVFLDYLIADEK
jgi:hypothetical protein